MRPASEARRHRHDVLPTINQVVAAPFGEVSVIQAEPQQPVPVVRSNIRDRPLDILRRQLREAPTEVELPNPLIRLGYRQRAEAARVVAPKIYGGAGMVGSCILPMHYHDNAFSRAG